MFYVYKYVTQAVRHHNSARLPVTRLASRHEEESQHAKEPTQSFHWRGARREPRCGCSHARPSAADRAERPQRRALRVHALVHDLGTPPPGRLLCLPALLRTRGRRGQGAVLLLLPAVVDLHSAYGSPRLPHLLGESRLVLATFVSALLLLALARV